MILVFLILYFMGALVAAYINIRYEFYDEDNGCGHPANVIVYGMWPISIPIVLTVYLANRAKEKARRK